MTLGAMILTGGGAMLRHLPDLLMEVTGVPCYVADDPLSFFAGPAWDFQQLLAERGEAVRNDHVALRTYDAIGFFAHPTTMFNPNRPSPMWSAVTNSLAANALRALVSTVARALSNRSNPAIATRITAKVAMNSDTVAAGGCAG